MKKNKIKGKSNNNSKKKKNLINIKKYSSNFTSRWSAKKIFSSVKLKKKFKKLGMI
jgi:hypothetical protein